MQRGFTIIELLLVVIMLGILGYALIESVPSATAGNVLAAARQVASDIEYAKQNAMMTGVKSGAVFNLNANYIVYQSTSATPLNSPLTLQSMNTTLSTNYPNVKINSNYTVEFDSFGSPTTGGGGSVSLTDGTYTHTVSVTANTGMVSVQ